MIEISKWWYVLYCLQILYETKKSTGLLVFNSDSQIAFIELLLQLPGLLYLLIFTVKWFLGRT